MSIVAFDVPGLGSATDELRTLGVEFTLHLLPHCQNVKTNPEVCENYQVYATYGGIDMYRALVGSQFAIYAVEAIDVGDVKISILFAGQYGVPVRVGGYDWDGGDDESLRRGLLLARAQAHFR